MTTSMNIAVNNKLTRYQRYQICVIARCDERSIQSAYAGGNVRNTTLLRVAEAALKLGLPMPPNSESTQTKTPKAK